MFSFTGSRAYLSCTVLFFKKRSLFLIRASHERGEMRGGETRNAIKFITERAAMQEGGAAANEMLCSSPLLCSSSRQEGKGKEGTEEREDNFLGTPFPARPSVAHGRVGSRKGC